jgi:hypothetical protein
VLCGRVVRPLARRAGSCSEVVSGGKKTGKRGETECESERERSCIVREIKAGRRKGAPSVGRSKVAGPLRRRWQSVTGPSCLLCVFQLVADLTTTF